MDEFVVIIDNIWLLPRNHVSEIHGPEWEPLPCFYI